VHTPHRSNLLRSELLSLVFPVRALILEPEAAFLKKYGLVDRVDQIEKGLVVVVVIRFVSKRADVMTK